MFRRLDDARSLTANRLKIAVAAIAGDLLKFFDYYLIAFVLAFIIKPWHLTFGEAAIVGTSDIVTPKATLDAIVPSFMYFTAWLVLCGCGFLFFGFETGKQPISAINNELGEIASAGARK